MAFIFLGSTRSSAAGGDKPGPARAEPIQALLLGRSGLPPLAGPRRVFVMPAKDFAPAQAFRHSGFEWSPTGIARGTLCCAPQAGDIPMPLHPRPMAVGFPA